MQIKRFIEQESKTHTYIIIDEKSAIIIDPVESEVFKYLEFLEINNLKLKYALDTHIHADHITGSGLLRSKTNCQIAMSALADVKNLDIKLSDNQDLPFGKHTIRVIYTPGHTLESVCYLINDRLFTGDTLLINACGRTDFQGGSSEQLFDSIFNKLLTLPDETIIYPGHDYNCKTVSNIVQERVNNPRLQMKSVEEFADLMAGLNLPPPKFIDVALPRNKKCGEV